MRRLIAAARLRRRPIIGTYRNATGRTVMGVIESTPVRVVLRSGSTTLTLDKSAGKAVLQRKLLFWPMKPMELPLAEVADVAVDAGVDRASGIDVCSTMLIARSGAAWALPAADKRDAQTTADTVRDFLGLKS
jgi:hypothetical protein